MRGEAGFGVKRIEKCKLCLLMNMGWDLKGWGERGIELRNKVSDKN
jgi:hypothetical protein